MEIIDRKIKKYEDVLTTLKENKRHRAKDDNYNYDVDIMNTKWFIQDLQMIKKASESRLINACLDQALPMQRVVNPIVCDNLLHNTQVEADGRCHWCEGKELI